MYVIMMKRKQKGILRLTYGLDTGAAVGKLCCVKVRKKNDEKKKILILILINLILILIQILILILFQFLILAIPSVITTPGRTPIIE